MMMRRVDTLALLLRRCRTRPMDFPCPRLSLPALNAPPVLRQAQPPTRAMVTVTRTDFSALKRKEEYIHMLHADISECYGDGRYGEGLKVSIELLELCKTHFGPGGDAYKSESLGGHHPVIASAHNNIALMNKMLGKHEEARKHYESSLGHYVHTVGKKHPSYATAVHNLGGLCRSMADHVLTEEDTNRGRSAQNLQRGQLLDESISFFEEALTVRSAELGDSHPNTVASRSNLGATLSAHIIHWDTPTIGNTPEKKRKKSSRLSRLTEERWSIAEGHLRKALESSLSGSDDDGDREGEGEGNGDSEGDEGTIYSKITTLQSAGSAQNLAVCLKVHADRDVAVASGGAGDKAIDDERYAEALKLYQAALAVRSSKLGGAHPDTVATKFSLAELLAITGDRETSDILRQEIVASVDQKPYTRTKSTVKNNK